MKIFEIGDVVQHPAVAREAEFTDLLHASEDRMDDIIAFIMDDNNAKARRLDLLRHLDELLGEVEDHYTDDDLEDFMHDQGEISADEADEIARDLKFPPYHLSSVDEDSDEDLPTGEYEVCQNCFGDGCHYCNKEGLIDVTGEYERPNFD